MGPAMAQSIAAFLYFADPRHGLEFWGVETLICLFWTFPFVLKASGSLRLPAYLSVQTLSFVALFGSFFYGGVSSPFLPWLLVSLLLGFFYLANRPGLILTSLFAQLALFVVADIIEGGFPERVPISQLGSVALISALSATIYMWWMSIYYAHVLNEQSDTQREAERHRETAERLRTAVIMAERANQSKLIFLAKMSHELRTPLNAVIGYSALLLDETRAENGDDDLVADLTQIHTAGGQLLRLVDEVLDLGRIESDTVELCRERLDLRTLIEDVLITARPATTANGNVMEVQAADSLGEIVTDGTKLRQCLINLLSNASKFTQNGKVTLVATRERNPGGDWIRLQVTDTGIGIAKEDISRLFQQFEQAGRDLGGTGLGLAIARRFCEMMGGSIWLESELGVGSTFTIRIPAELAVSDSPAQPDFQRDEAAQRLVA